MFKKCNDRWETYGEIGHRISYYRKQRNMTQKEMARELKISRQHIGAIEAPNVKRKVSLDLLLNIADLLEVEPKYFLEYKEAPLRKIAKKSKK